MPITPRRRAFTMAELLVVIGIIVLLMSILLPVVKKVRYAGYSADTENEISQIANACNQYYSTFNAYPGPFSNDQIEAFTVNSADTYSLEGYANGQPTGRQYSRVPVTGPENLVLGLLGGLRPEDGNSTPPIYPFAPDEVGLGPLSLNPSAPARTPSFLPNLPNGYLMWSEAEGRSTTPFQTTSYQAKDAAGKALMLSSFTDLAGNQANNNVIPVFVDRFPAPGPLPILYLRARTGAAGVISYYANGSTSVVDPTTNLPAQYQYDLGDIIAFTNTRIGLPTGITHNLVGVENTNTLTWPPPPPAKAGTSGTSDAFGYFVNTSITPTNTTSGQYIMNTARPRSVDQFILISAGQDGIYGNADDITSFGSVTQ